MKNKVIHRYYSTYGLELVKNWDGIPIEVGANNRNNYIYSLLDSDGVNISVENPYMAELTGMYYIWKNIIINDNELIGFFHYNKTLRASNRLLNKVFTKDENAWIVKKPDKARVHDYIEDIETIEDILKGDYPDYYKTWKRIYNNDGSTNDKSCNAANMFITSKKQFDKYCEWLFPIIFSLKDRIGSVDRVPYHKRYCAFIAERLLTVYIETNNLKKVTVEIDYGESLFRYLVRILVSRLPYKVISKLPFQKKGSSSYLR